MSDEQSIRKGLEQDAQWLETRMSQIQQENSAIRIADELRFWMEKQRWSQTKVAKKLGVSPAVVSQFLAGKYAGKLDDLINKVVNLINTQARKDRRPKNEEFIETTVAKEIYALVTQTESFSDEDEGRIGMIIGDSGHGKSHCLREYSKANRNTIYVELDDAMTPTLVFAEIAKACGIYEAGSMATVTRRIIEELENRNVIIILDEASGLNVSALNKLRQVIAIKARCPLVLAGNADLLKTAMQPTTRKGHESLDQFTSRLIRILNLDSQASDKDGGLYTVEDIRKLYQYGGIKLKASATQSLQKIAKTPRSGRLRTCAHLIAALHTADIVIEKGEIDSNLIMKVINTLELPVRCRLPIYQMERIEEEPQSMAKTA